MARGRNSLDYHARTYCQVRRVTRYYDETKDRYEEV